MPQRRIGLPPSLGYSTIEAVRAEIQDKLSVYAHASKRGDTAGGQIVRQQVEDFLVAMFWGDRVPPSPPRSIDA